MSEEQWKQWQERDKELVDNTYEKDLEHALLLSKLDLEEQKLETENSDKNQEKKLKSGTKGKKHQPMNLHQFNQMLEEKDTKSSVPDQPKKSNFFDNINEQAKNILRKEELQSIGQTQKNKSKFCMNFKYLFSLTASLFSVPTDFIPDKLPVSSVELDTNQEMEQLRVENVMLKQELDALKEKCKKVATILKNAEVKEKVDLVLEIRNLKKTQEEMSNEMSQLYIELEQEKSRASQAMQHHSNTGGSDNKGSRSAMRKSVRFDEQSFLENQQ